MPSKANIIWVDQEQSTIYNCDYSEPDLLSAALLGGEYIHQRLTAIPVAEEIYNQDWGEGALLADTDRKILLIWQESDLVYTPALRRVYLYWLRNAWQGWEVFWAHYGMLDITRYLGLPDEQILTDDHTFQCYAFFMESSDQMGGINQSLVTVQWKNDPLGQTNYLLPVTINQVLCAGSQKALDFLHDNPPLDLPENLLDEPISGTLFIDVPTQRVMFSNPENILDHRNLAHFQSHWPDWTVEMHCGTLMEHLELAGVDPAPHLPSQEEIVVELMSILGIDPVSTGDQPDQDSPPTPGDGEKASAAQISAWVGHLVQKWAANPDALQAALSRPCRLPASR